MGKFQTKAGDILRLRDKQLWLDASGILMEGGGLALVLTAHTYSVGVNDEVVEICLFCGGSTFTYTRRNEQWLEAWEVVG